LNTKVKVGGTWTVAKPHVKVGGTWTKVKRAYSKVGGVWNKTYDYEWVYTFANGVHTDIDIDTLAGIDKFHNVRIVIPSGATLVASSTSAYALQTGSGYTGILTIQNSGKIIGRGGNGGNGGYGYSYNQIAQPTDGASGGPSVLIQSDVTIINTGTILGGGGGGGGAAGIVHVGTAYSGGGGGGGGYPYGAGGSGGSTTHSGANGTAGTVSSAGAGGNGGFDGTSGGGVGGTGGGLGAVGSLGGDVVGEHGGTHTIESGQGAGGATGATYYNPSSFTVS
tara:strand:+ start:375 stop:1211 length:837 start_codon:yes stop_codon:yes gene_type:complete